MKTVKLLVTFVMTCFFASATLAKPVVQHCTETEVAGVTWDGTAWANESIRPRAYELSEVDLAACFKHAPPEKRAYWDAKVTIEAKMEVFTDFSLSCLEMKSAGQDVPFETFSCVHKVRTKDDRVIYDCEGLGWRFFVFTPGETFHFSSIHGANDPKLKQKGPMTVSVGTCSSAQ